MRVLVYCGIGTALKLQSTLSFLLKGTVVEGHCSTVTLALYCYPIELTRLSSVELFHYLCAVILS
jgi:hypothetical protein